jgi:hypothetical protein
MSNFCAHIVAAFHRATQSPVQPNSLHSLRAGPLGAAPKKSPRLVATPTTPYTAQRIVLVYI